MIKRLAFILLFVLAVPAMAAASHPPTKAEIFAALRAGDSIIFTEEDVRIRPIGAMTVGGTRYFIVYYAWEQSWKHAVGFPHAAYRLVIFTRDGEKLVYLGFYAVEKPPIGIRGNKVIFPYPKRLGNALTIGETGPPQEPTLGGQPRLFGQ